MKKHDTNAPSPKRKLNLTNASLEHKGALVQLEDAMTNLTKYDEAVEVHGGRIHAIKRL